MNDTFEEILLISFSLSSLMLKNCIFFKAEFIQRNFARILLLGGIPYAFLKIGRTPIWQNTSWWQHLYVIDLLM